MTLLQIMPDNNPAAVSLRTKDAAHIVTALGDVGVRFDRWTTRPSPTHPTGPEELLERYATEVDALKREGGYRLVDVVRMVPDDGDLGWPAKADEARRRFLDEHRHSEDEVRFFTNGRGCFYLHLDRHVYAVVCTAGDLLSVPAGTLHWFDMGPRPEFAAIRFFEQEDGWIGEFTGDPVGSAFPRLDQLVET